MTGRMDWRDLYVERSLGLNGNNKGLCWKNVSVEESNTGNNPGKNLSDDSIEKDNPGNNPGCARVG